VLLRHATLDSTPGSSIFFGIEFGAIVDGRMSTFENGRRPPIVRTGSQRRTKSWLYYDWREAVRKQAALQIFRKAGRRSVSADFPFHPKETESVWPGWNWPTATVSAVKSGGRISRQSVEGGTSFSWPILPTLNVNRAMSDEGFFRLAKTGNSIASCCLFIEIRRRTEPIETPNFEESPLVRSARCRPALSGHAPTGWFAIHMPHH